MKSSTKDRYGISLKSDFPFFANHSDLIYLDSAATTQKPHQVLDAIQDFYENVNANPARGLYDLSFQATQLHSECRQAVANFLNAAPEQIIFTSGCTDSLNQVALNFDLKPDDEIVLSICEHHSNLVPWQKLAKRTGAKLSFIYDFPDAPAELLQMLARKITKQTKVVAITAVSNVTGTQLPVKAIAKRAHSVGAKVILDAAQAVAHLSLDVKQLDVDFLAFSGHKMYAPMGIGVLYVKNPADFCPTFFGGGAIERVSERQTILANDISRFEPGTRNLAGEVGLKAAIEWLSEKRQIANSSELMQNLVHTTYDKLSKLPYIELISSRNAVGIVSFNLKSVHSHDVATILNDEGLCIRAGNHCAEPLMYYLGIPGCCRVSFGLYNDENDAKRLITGIKKAWEVLK